MDVAVDKLRPRIADADQRPAAERLVADACRLQPRAMKEAVEISPVEPFGASPAVRAVITSAAHRRHLRSFLGVLPVTAVGAQLACDSQTRR